MTRHVLLTAIAFGLAGMNLAPGKAEAQKEPGPAGWADLFPTLPGYSRTIEPVAVEGDKKNPIYRQSGRYLWTGGADRRLKVTVARNAEFKKMYSKEGVQTTKPAPEKIEIGKHSAWLWKFEGGNPAKEEMPLHSRLVVLLGDDRVVIVELSGRGPFGGDVTTAVEKMDLAKVKAALDDPPPGPR